MPISMFSENTIQDRSKQKLTNIIAVAAGKGGVGKSAVTVNLALGLQHLGKRVGILDADVYGPSLRQMLPEITPPTQLNGKLVPAICYGGIRTMSMAYFRKETSAAAIRAPIANGIIKQFLESVDWGSLDYLLIDFPPGTGDIQLTLGQQAHLSGALMVTTPQEVALLDVRKAINLFDHLKIPIWGVVENMSYFLPAGSEQPVYLFGEGGGQRLAAECAVPLLAQIPVDPAIAACGDSGTPLLSYAPDSPGSVAFAELAQQVINCTGESSQPDNSMVSDFVLTQTDPHTIKIEWKDGMMRYHRLSDLQKLCPCAGCVDEVTHLRRSTAPQVAENVEVLSLRSVGRYAIKIQFSSGCSNGIYDLASLRN